MAGWKSKRKHNLVRKFGNHCYLCGDQFPTEELTLDHVVPKSVANRLAHNTQLACRPCNALKSNLPLPTMLQRIQKILINQVGPSWVAQVN